MVKEKPSYGPVAPFAGTDGSEGQNANSPILPAESDERSHNQAKPVSTHYLNSNETVDSVSSFLGAVKPLATDREKKWSRKNAARR
jgi:hypothetical protein